MIKFSPEELAFFDSLMSCFVTGWPEANVIKPQMPKVEACPFCSASASIKEISKESGPYWRVVCSSCGASGPSTILRVDVGAHDAEMVAIEQWNQRA